MAKKSSKTLTPRPYLSWSQLQLFERNPELYREVYIGGREIYSTSALETGKELAMAIENGESDNAIIEHLRRFLPNYPKIEYEIKAKLGDIQLLGKLDGYNTRKKIIGEIKTGKKWTQKMVDTSGQLTFYALLIWLKYKTLPEIYLHWCEANDGELTGEIKSFKTKRSKIDLIKFSSRIKKAWEGIKKLCQEK